MTIELLRQLIGGDQRVLMMGLGNEFRSDDGAGVQTVRWLSESGIPGPSEDGPSFMVMEAGRQLLSHVHTVELARPSVIIFVDAANLGLDPGSTVMLGEEQVFETNLSTHENNFSLVLAYLRKVLPDLHFYFIGFQYSSEEMSPGMNLSPQVEIAVRTLVSAVIDIVKPPRQPPPPPAPQQETRSVWPTQPHFHRGP